MFWAISISAFTVVAITPLMIYKARKRVYEIPKNLKLLLPLGLLSALTLISQLTAINMTLVAYVISIKRLSAVFSVLFGYWLFKEKNIKERLLGVIIMVIGVLFISFS